MTSKQNAAVVNGLDYIRLLFVATRTYSTKGCT